MNTTFLGITWASAHNILYMPLLIGTCVIIAYAYRKRKTIIHSLVSPQWNKHLVMHYNAYKLLLKSILLAVGFLSLFLALLQPQWGKTEETIHQEGRDILVCLDISRSMLAQDCTPNRLEYAKEKIKKLLKILPCERFGLLLFAGSALIQCPLTTDYGAFSMFLDQVDCHTIWNGSTFIESALKQALALYKQSGAVKKTKLLLLCTDGEDFSPHVDSLKEQLKNEGITIITYGIGTVHGAPIPVLDESGMPEGHQKDDKGNIVISSMNSAMLKALARDIGGNFVQSQENDADIQTIKSYVYTFEKEQGEEKKISHVQEQYPWFVMISFMCFLLEWIL